jgi:hypothetical protein
VINIIFCGLSEKLNLRLFPCLLPTGVSGNPGGRSHSGTSSRDCLQAALSPDEWAERVAQLCRKGSIRALEVYGAYVFGRPPSSAEEEILRRLSALEEMQDE